jgi:hypothetical protein
MLFFAKLIPVKDAVRMDVKTENIKKSIVAAEPVIGGQFSNHYHCQWPYREVTTTRMVAGTLELYRRLLPVVTVYCWPLPVVLHRTIQLTITDTTVAAAATSNIKAPVTIAWKPLATLDKDVVQVNVKMEKVVTAYQVNGRFSHHNQCQRSYCEVTTTWTIAGILELYRRFCGAFFPFL